VATVLVQNGTLKNGDIVIAGTATGRVRMMTNDKGERVNEAGPSFPVEIMGLSEAPNAGDVFNAVADERMARELVEQRKHQEKEEAFKKDAKVNLDDLFNQIGSGIKTFNIIVKADVQGSAEAVKQSLVKLSNDEVKVAVIHAGVGGITESDVMLAAASNALIIGFNIRPDKKALDAAARDLITEAGYGAYFNHRLGHFIGQTDHEKGDVSSANTTVARPGMIFSIEPGVYLPGEFGVRVEDLVLVTEDGCEVLNHNDKHWDVVGK